jgi:hypothetical protein
MLLTEALAAIACVIIGLLVLRVIQSGGTTAVSSQN